MAHPLGERLSAAAFGLAFGRAPTADETQLALEFLAAPPGKDEKLTRWEQYAQALLGKRACECGAA